MSATSAIPSPVMPPAPTPWMTRQTMSMPIEVESPQSMLPTRKVTMAAPKSTRRPNRSPSLPSSGMVLTWASR